MVSFLDKSVKGMGFDLVTALDGHIFKFTTHQYHGYFVTQNCFKINRSRQREDYGYIDN